MAATIQYRASPAPPLPRRSLVIPRAATHSAAGQLHSAFASPAVHAPAGTQNNVIALSEYRRGVGLVVVNREGLVFAARRMDDTEQTWQMPQGGIDRFENPMVAALRELQEETGIINARIVASIDSWLHYDFPTKVRSHLTGEWVRYRGQTQKWYLIDFHGTDEEIDLSCHGEPEFSEYAWMPLEQLPASVVGFKQPVYHRVAQHFSPVIAKRWGVQSRCC